MVIPVAWHMPLAVLGLLLGLLAAAAIVRRYQEYKAHQRIRLRALAARAGALERALEQLSRIPLSRPLRAAVRRCIAQHYRVIRRIHRGYRDIDRLLGEANQRAEGDAGPSGGQVPAINGPEEYARLLQAMDVLISALASRAMARESGAQAAQWLQEACERRAELSARYFIVQAHRAQLSGKGRGAATLLHSLLVQLHKYGPDTPFVKELYREAEGMYERALRGRTMLDEPDSGTADDQRSNRSSAA